MSARFTVLASGSSGNAALVQAEGFGLLIDCGLSARQIAHRLAARGMTWRNVNAAIISHTHSDHWTRSALKALAIHRVPLFCHDGHIAALAHCQQFVDLQAAGLVRTFMASQWLVLSRSLRVFPHEISHDSEPTFAFRCEGCGSLFGPSWSIGYAADLGDWDDALVQRLANTDLLAIEFNHDEQMQRTRGRPRHLIDRVLGPRGHLSNRQGASLVAAIRDASLLATARGLIALHRSRECNTVILVERNAQHALNGSALPLRLAHQHEPTDTIELVEPRVFVRRLPIRRIKPKTNGLFDDRDES